MDKIICQTHDSWNQIDIDNVLIFLKTQEIMFYKLVLEGKGLTDITVILGLNSVPHCRNEMIRLKKLIYFYYENLHLIERLFSNKIQLCSRDKCILDLFIVKRMSCRNIMKKLNFDNVDQVAGLMKTISRRLLKLGHCEIVQMIKNCAKNVTFRKHDRFVFKKDKWRDEMIKHLDKNIGKIFYTWGGQSLDKKSIDCSGLVIEEFKMFHRLPEDFNDTTAKGLSKIFGRCAVSEIERGDLLFYGSSWKNVTHVMIYYGQYDKYENCVIGMTGGRRNMKKILAKKVGAALWLKTSIKYRHDFLGCGKV